MAVQPTPARVLTRPERERHQRRSARLTRYNDVHALRGTGQSVRAIATTLHLSRQTVRRLLRADVFPEIGQRKRTGSKLDPFIPYLHRHYVAGNTNGSALWRALRDEQGYDGSRALVAAWVARHRHLGPVPAQPLVRRGRPPVHAPSPPASVPARRLSARQVAWLCCQRADTLSGDERTIIARCGQHCAEVQQSYALIQEFLRIIRERHPDALDGWLHRMATSEVAELQHFAAGLQRDYQAVIAALRLPFSNGVVEGHIHRLKLIKRSGYGRAKFDLLRHRVLAT